MADTTNPLTATGAVGGNPLDNTSDDPRTRHPLVLGDTTHHSITEDVSRIAEVPLLRTHPGLIFGFLLALAWLGILGAMIGYLFLVGTGVWGVNNPVGWGFAIVNFVFWVGIGHAGTLISAILLLFRQEWRTSDQPLRGGDDDLRGDVRGHLPVASTSAVSWLAYWLFPLPQHDGSTCGRSFAARCCGTSSRSRRTHGLAAVLVRRG